MRNPNLFKQCGFSDMGGVEYDTDITLRDILAGLAMQGMLANAEVYCTHDGYADTTAADAVKQADALLAQLDKETT